MQVLTMTMAAPVNIPHRRPKVSVTGPAMGRAAMAPMLYIAKTRPVEEPEDFLEQLLVRRLSMRG